MLWELERMTYTGTIRNGVVVLDNGAKLAEGTPVRVDVSPISNPPKGSPASLMRLAGTLNDDEARAILQAAKDCRQVDPALWNSGR